VACLDRSRLLWSKRRLSSSRHPRMCRKVKLNTTRFLLSKVSLSMSSSCAAALRRTNAILSTFIRKNLLPLPTPSPIVHTFPSSSEHPSSCHTTISHCNKDGFVSYKHRQPTRSRAVTALLTKPLRTFRKISGLHPSPSVSCAEPFTPIFLTSHNNYSDIQWKPTVNGKHVVTSQHHIFGHDLSRSA
jgi:hypothetical protein